MINFDNTNYTKAQQLKLTLLAFNKAMTGELPGMNMWVDLSIDDGGEPTVDDAAEAWRVAIMETCVDDAIAAVIDPATSIDLAPLVEQLKADGVWEGMPQGWSRA